MARTTQADAVPGYRGKDASIDELINYIDSKPPVPPLPPKLDDKSRADSGRNSKKKKRKDISVRSQPLPCDTDSNGEAESAVWSAARANANNDEFTARNEDNLLSAIRNHPKFMRKKVQKGLRRSANATKGGTTAGDKRTDAVSGEKPLGSESCFQKLPEDLSSSNNSDIVDYRKDAAGNVDSVFWHEGGCHSLGIEWCGAVSADDLSCSEVLKPTDRVKETDVTGRQHLTTTAAAETTVDKGVTDVRELGKEGERLVDERKDTENSINKFSDDEISFVPSCGTTTVCTHLSAVGELSDKTDTAIILPQPEVDAEAAFNSTLVSDAEYAESLGDRTLQDDDISTCDPGCYVADENSTCQQLESHMTGTNTPSSSSVSDTRDSMDCDGPSFADDYSSDVDAAGKCKVTPPAVDDKAFTVVTVKKKKRLQQQPSGKQHPETLAANSGSSCTAAAGGFVRRTWVNSDIKCGSGALSGWGRSGSKLTRAQQLTSAFAVVSTASDDCCTETNNAAAMQPHVMELQALGGTQSKSASGIDVAAAMTSAGKLATIVSAATLNLMASSDANGISGSVMADCRQPVHNDNTSVGFAPLTTDVSVHSTDTVTDAPGSIHEPVNVAVMPNVSLVHASHAADNLMLATSRISRQTAANVVSTGVVGHRTPVFLDTRQPLTGHMRTSSPRPDISFGFELDLVAEGATESLNVSIVSQVPPLESVSTVCRSSGDLFVMHRDSSPMVPQLSVGPSVTDLPSVLSAGDPGTLSLSAIDSLSANAISFIGGGDEVICQPVNRASALYRSDDVIDSCELPVSVAQHDTNSPSANAGSEHSSSNSVQTVSLSAPVGLRSGHFDIYGAQLFLSREFENVKKLQQHSPHCVLYYGTDL
jgi:hypothetical protein